nr:amino acid ABC transporter permease [Pseudomonas aeruginosa]
MSRVFVSPLATPFHSLVSIFPIPSRYISIFRAPPPRYFSPSLNFAAPEWLPEDLKAWLYAGNIEAASAIVALTLYTAAFMSEDMRSGIRAVPTVQLEAARALGFGYLASMRLVILPQALRITVPPLISQTLNLWKNTSIATVIGVAELMYQAGQVESSTFRSFESFAFATVAYLSVSLLITGAAAWYQQRYPGVERR